MADVAIPGARAARGHLSGFREFLLKQNALALAIGVVIGGAIGRVVAGVVEDVIMPIIGVILPGGEWRNAQFVLSGENAIKYGDLLGRILDFIIVAAVVYFVTKAILEREQQPAAAPSTRTCRECVDPIPIAARKCRSCGSAVSAAA